jgi:hydrogenase maturation protease
MAKPPSTSPDPRETGEPVLLVIGYGNELRSDDALGRKLASAIELLRLDRVRVLSVHQLTPELAEPISQADAVVFLDAGVTEHAAIQVERLFPVSGAGVGSHLGDPKVLLSMALLLFGKAPPGWWITVRAYDLGFGENLSPSAQAMMPQALEAFEKVRQEWLARRDAPL